MNSLKGKNAVVTGAAGGIGRAVVYKFAKSGVNVWACVHHLNDALVTDMSILAERYGVVIRLEKLDLGNEDSIKSVVRSIVSKGEQIDILVNVAGTVGCNCLFQMTRLCEMRRVMEVNFFGPMMLTQLISRVMARKKSGTIVNLASITAYEGDPAQLEYSASKAAIIAATKKLAIELGGVGIRVNAVAPGLTDTSMLNGMDEAVEGHLLSRMSIKRRADPMEIANVIAFLSSDESSFMTGQILRVDGGIGA